MGKQSIFLLEQLLHVNRVQLLLSFLNRGFRKGLSRTNFLHGPGLFKFSFELF